MASRPPNTPQQVAIEAKLNLLRAAAVANMCCVTANLVVAYSRSGALGRPPCAGPAIARSYVDGLRALRPGNAQLVSVAVIAGVPPDLLIGSLPLDTNAMKAFYTRVLDDPRMQPVAQTGWPTEPGAALRPSCSNSGATAYPPRRLVELARQFGPRGSLGSLCADDLTSAVFDQLGGWISSAQLGGWCTPRRFPRDAHGLTSCRVTWELPAPHDPGQPLTPSSCADRPDLLSTPKDGHPTRSPRGRPLCDMHQLPVLGAAKAGTLAPQPGEGFFLDEFSLNWKKQCLIPGEARLSFTTHAQPPDGVTVYIDCQDALPAATATPGDAGSTDAEVSSACQ